MSLVEPTRVLIAFATLAAVGAPALLLSGDASPIPARAARTVTPVAFAAPGALSFALAAPPFTLGRTPAAAAEAAAAQAEAVPPPPPPPPPPALVGVVIGDRGRAVALAKGAAGETVTLSRGQAVDGWTLVSIGRDRAVFELGGTRHTATLDFRNRTPAASASPPSPPPPPNNPTPDRNAS